VRHFHRSILSYLTGTIASLIASIALAWDGTPTGIPGQIDVAQGSGLGYRIYLSPAVSMCGNSNAWAYLNTTDINYSTYVATIMMAKAQGLIFWSTQRWTRTDSATLATFRSCS
jgi:hypothetical protein